MSNVELKRNLTFVSTKIDVFVMMKSNRCRLLMKLMFHHDQQDPKREQEEK